MFSLFSRKPTKDKFVQLAVKKLKQAGAVGTFEYREEDFSLRHGEQIFYMANTFESYCAAKEPHRSQVLDNAISIFFRKEEVDREKALSTVLAVVRERALFSTATLLWQIEGSKDTGPQVAHEPFSDWYSRALVLDAPGYMRLVNDEDLARWGMTFDEMFSIGVERLRESTPIKFEREHGQYFIGQWNDDYDTSRILLPEVFEKLGLEGDPVFVLPNRLTVMVAGSRDEKSVAAMLKKAEEVVQSQPRSQSTSPLTYRDGQLQDFTVSPSSGLLQAVQRARGIAALEYYTGQAAHLAEVYEQNGKDYFVASYKLQQHNETGAYLSTAVWSKGIPSLLPKADQLVFFDPEAETMQSAPFDRAGQVIGDLMLDTGMFPTRYYVSQFPTPEQLKSMGAEAL